MKKNLALVTGGFTAEKIISLQSARTIFQAIDPALCQAFLVVITSKDWFVQLEDQTFPVDKNDFSFVLRGEKISFHAAYIMGHGVPLEDGSIQGYFNLLGVPFVGPSLLNCAVTMNKFFTSSLLRGMGFKVAECVFLPSKNYDFSSIQAKIQYPCIVKPNDGGSSFGVSKVDAEEDLHAAIEEAFRHSSAVLVEEFIKGKEYSAGVTDFDGSARALAITGIEYEGAFFDFAAKYEGASREITPADLPIEQQQKIQSMLVAVYQALGLTATVRIDFMIRERDQCVFIIEINAIPGMSPASIVPVELEKSGIDLRTFVNKQIKRVL